MKRGRFISVEGIEGVGKTSNIEVLVSYLEKAGFEVLTTREPGGTPLAEDIRDLLMHRGDEAIPEIAELLMMFAARSLNVNNNIRPALNEGKWVICDRFTDSSRAYQGAGRGLPIETVDQLAEWVHGDLWPDLTILLDAPVDVGMARAGNRSTASPIVSSGKNTRFSLGSASAICSWPRRNRNVSPFSTRHEAWQTCRRTLLRLRSS